LFSFTASAAPVRGLSTFDRSCRIAYSLRVEERKGLILTGGAGPRIEVIIRDRSEWLVVAADSGLDLARSLGIVPDAIVGDMDSLSSPDVLEAYEGVDLERYDRAKDRTDTEIALDYLWKRSINAVTILGGGGGRLDHLLGIVALFDRDRHPARWFTEREEVVAIDDVIDVPCIPGSVVSFFPVGPVPARMTAEGLRWPLDGLEWRCGDAGISNECTGGRCRVKMLSGRLLLVRALSSVVRLE
jgi:thiamine pyrophosphokinase